MWLLRAMFLFETLLIANCAFAQEFSFALQSEPHSLDPAQISSIDAAFFYPQIYRGLYRYQNPEGLIPEGAKKCSLESSLRMICELNPEMKWSDGSNVQASEYVSVWQNMVRPNSRSPAVELLANVKNAMEIFSGKEKPENLGVRAIEKFKLEIRFSKPDPDFLYKLASPLLVPAKTIPFPDKKNAAALITNGPYKIKSWSIGSKVQLEPNFNYKFGNSKRPAVTVYFVAEDETALALYREGRLKMVRRLQAHEIKNFKDKPDYHKVSVARFDYVGFGPELENLPELRKALSLSVDYDALTKVVHSEGRFGCPSLPDSFMSKTPCIPFDLKRAKEAWSKLPKDVQGKPLKFSFSSSGGDQIKNTIEFMANQWKINLGANIRIEQMENSVFLNTLRTKTPAIFRKGVPVDRPTCLAAVENFKTAAPENFVHLKSSEFDQLTENLKTQGNKKSQCTRAIEYLIDNHRLIPLGQMFFSFLVKPEYKGWHINDMNQLDLSNLHVVNIQKAK